jgi:hypothetical protein
VSRVRATEPRTAPPERRRPPAAAGARLLDLQRRAGNRAVNRMVVARRLIVDGQRITSSQLTGRLRAALQFAQDEYANAADDDERAAWQHNINVLNTGLAPGSRLRAWAASDAGGVQYTNWGFIEAAAAAAARPGTDPLNERRPAAPGPVVQEILNLAHAVGAISSATPLHSTATFSEGRDQAFPTDEELALSFALYLEPESVARTPPGIPAAAWAQMQREQSRLGVCHETAK